MKWFDIALILGVLLILFFGYRQDGCYTALALAVFMVLYFIYYWLRRRE